MLLDEPTFRGKSLVLLSLVCFLCFDKLKAEEAASSLTSAVDQAFDTYPSALPHREVCPMRDVYSSPRMSLGGVHRLTGEGRLKPVDVRSFLEHIRREAQ
eukprot:9177982-Pyramimonas_sp.AAC.1